MMNELQEMMNETQDMKVKEAIQKVINEMSK
jgi:predicted DNA-binding protein